MNPTGADAKKTLLLLLSLSPIIVAFSGLLKNCGPTGHLSVYWSTSDETSVMVSWWSPRNLGTQEALLLRKHQTVGSPSAPYKETL